MEFIGGECPKHGPKLMVGEDFRCLKCDKQAELAARKAPQPQVTVADPGESAFSGAVLSAPPLQTRERALAPLGMEDGLKRILDVLAGLPMPKDIKQFKTLQQVRTRVEKLLEETQSGTH